MRANILVNHEVSRDIFQFFAHFIADVAQFPRAFRIRADVVGSGYQRVRVVERHGCAPGMQAWRRSVVTWQGQPPITDDNEGAVC